eukprot:Gb_20860 [translate_table: standard]
MALSGALKSIVGMAFPFIFLIVITICLCIDGCSVEEREALLQFKKTLDDSNGHLSSWKGEDCCNWRGVDCYGKPRLVVTLDLHGLNLSNSGNQINCSLMFQLKYLRDLDLSSNDFYGMQLPLELGMLKDLTYLNMSYALPCVFLDLSAYFDHFYNVGLKSSGLEWVGSMSSLNYISLDGINLGTISTQSWGNAIGSLSKLTHLRLSPCSLSGSIPSIPSSLLNLSSLAFLDLSRNSFTSGRVPSWLIGKYEELDFPGFEWNELTGEICDNLYHFRFLTHLDLAWDAIGGIIPHSIGNLSSIQYLDLSRNNLGGEIPSSLGNIHAPTLVTFILADCPQLLVLNLANNQLEGNVPEQFGRLQYLQSLRFQENKLNGSLPLSITNCSQLQVLDLGNNAFIGTIPSWIGNFSQLQILIMKFNSFEGRIPLEIGRLSQLRVLDISSNYISGSIPKSILHLTGMTTPLQDGVVLQEYFFILIGLLDATGYSDSYRDSLELTTKDQDLHYPYILSTLTCIDLSKNLLTGHVPTDIGKLKGLMFLNLSMNQLSGPIPLELCGDPLTKKCYPAGSYPPPPSEVEEENEEENGSEIPWWEIGVGLSYGMGFAGVVSVLAVRVEWRKKMVRNDGRFYMNTSMPFGVNFHGL